MFLCVQVCTLVPKMLLVMIISTKRSIISSDMIYAWGKFDSSNNKKRMQYFSSITASVPSPLVDLTLGVNFPVILCRVFFSTLLACKHESRLSSPFNFHFSMKFQLCILLYIDYFPLFRISNSNPEYLQMMSCSLSCTSMQFEWHV